MKRDPVTWYTLLTLTILTVLIFAVYFFSEAFGMNMLEILGAIFLTIIVLIAALWAGGIIAFRYGPEE